MFSVIAQIDRSSAEPIRSQIAEAFSLAIASGALAASSRLPSIRSLSARLGVSPATAAAAYDDLVARRLVVSRARSGFAVAGRRGADPSRTDSGEVQLSMNRIEPNLRLHPAAEFARVLALTAEDDPGAGGYEDYRGSIALRRALAELDRDDGIDSEPGSGMLVTAGAQQAISLLARTAGAGARVAIEDPTYPGARLAFRSAGAELVPIASDGDGPDPDDLDAACEGGRLDLFYCVPTYGNPGGRSWSPAARERVLRASAREGFTVVEDDYLGDLDYLGERLPRLAALAPSIPGSRVIRVRTFSKCLLPALRIAEVTADARTIETLLVMKSADDICGSALMQRSLACFLREGRYAAHLERVRPHYASVRKSLREALANSKSGLRFDDPPAGLCLLGSLEPGLDVASFVSGCGAEGILISSGPDFWNDRNDGAARFRIGFGNLEPGDVGRAAARARNGFFERSLL